MKNEEEKKNEEKRIKMANQIVTGCVAMVINLWHGINSKNNFDMYIYSGMHSSIGRKADETEKNDNVKLGIKSDGRKKKHPANDWVYGLRLRIQDWVFDSLNSKPNNVFSFIVLSIFIACDRVWIHMDMCVFTNLSFLFVPNQNCLPKILGTRND